MKIHVRIPFSLEKNLANEYNHAFSGVPDEDWVCLLDYDTMFLTPNAIPILYEYVKAFPDTGLFTAFTNRIHQLATDQLFLGSPSNDFDVKNWAWRAKIQAMTETNVTEIKKPISGFLMLVAKKTWNEIKFRGPGCLGVDNNFSADVLQSGRKIYRMDRILVFHMYRMDDIRNKKHLL